MFTDLKKDIFFLKTQKSRTPTRLPILFKIIFDPSIYITINYRISSFFVKIHLYIVAKFFWLINYIVFHVDIDPRAKLSGGCFFVHPIGIVIGSGVQTNGYVKIYQGATLGGSFGQYAYLDGKKIMQPYIESYSIISPGARVLGPVIIPSHTIVGANVVVTKTQEKSGIYLNDRTLTDTELLKNEFDKWPE